MLAMPVFSEIDELVMILRDLELTSFFVKVYCSSSGNVFGIYENSSIFMFQVAGVSSVNP